MFMAGKAEAALREALAGELEYLRKQIAEITAPLSEELFWVKPIEPGNSVGHLVLHLTGNLSHFAGARLGGTGYVRDREKEFIDPVHPTKEEAFRRLDEAIAVYRRVLMGLTEDQLLAAPQDSHLGADNAGGMVRLVSHFALHRGQISYITRLVLRGDRA
jgi:uncharacterized damage-inducible protein DinB